MEKAYSTYKDSGFYWFNNIPSGWNLVSFKYLVEKIYTGGTPTTSNSKFWVDKGQGIPWVSISDITKSNSTLLETKKEVSKEGVKSKDLDILPKGTLLLSIFASLGKTIRLGIDATVNQAILGIETNERLSIDFLEYLFIDAERYISYYSSMSTQENLNLTKIRNLNFPIPPKQEQTQIASYLDYHTQLIDDLITKKETLIQKLQEQRQAIINEAVTKGLNPNVKLKDSGIEWLGEIPEHWEVVKFIRFCNLQQGLQIPISQRVLEKVNGALEYITTKSIHNPDDYRQYVVGAKQSVICNEDEVLLGRTGNTGEVVTGVSGVFHNNFFKINFNEDFITKDYLVHYLNTSFIQGLIGIVAGTTTIPDLNHGDFLNLPFIMPPIKEQIDIVEKINSKYQIIDKSISDIQTSIQKLKEYRQSLISEAVTGKIDVRDWQASKS